MVCRGFHACYPEHPWCFLALRGPKHTRNIPLESYYGCAHLMGALYALQLSTISDSYILCFASSAFCYNSFYAKKGGFTRGCSNFLYASWPSWNYNRQTDHLFLDSGHANHWPRWLCLMLTTNKPSQCTGLYFFSGLGDMRIPPFGTHTELPPHPDERYPTGIHSSSSKFEIEIVHARHIFLGRVVRGMRGLLDSQSECTGPYLIDKSSLAITIFSSGSLYEL